MFQLSIASGCDNIIPTLFCKSRIYHHCTHHVVYRTWTRWCQQRDQTGRPSWLMWQTSIDILKLIPGSSADTGHRLLLSLFMQIVVFLVLIVHIVCQQLTGILCSVFLQWTCYVICSQFVQIFIVLCRFLCMLFTFWSVVISVIRLCNYEAAKQLLHIHGLQIISFALHFQFLQYGNGTVGLVAFDQRFSLANVPDVICLENNVRL